MDMCSARSIALNAQVSTTWLPAVLTSFPLHPVERRTALPVRAGTSTISVAIVVSSLACTVRHGSGESLQELPDTWGRGIAEEAIRRRRLDDRSLVEEHDLIG